MNDIYKVANNFLVKIKNYKVQESLPIKIAAGRKNRKQLERDLLNAKSIYSKRNMSLREHEKAHEDLSSVIDKERDEVSKHRKEIMKAYEILRNMDLHDVAEVRYMSNDDVGYVKKQRLYRLEKDELIPFKKKKPLDDDIEEAESENDADYKETEDNQDELDADDLLSSLVS